MHQPQSTSMSRFCHWKLECMHWLKNCKLCSCICQLNKQDTVIRIRRKKVTDTIVVVTSQRPRNWTNVIEWKWVAHSNSNRWSHLPWHWCVPSASSSLPDRQRWERTCRSPLCPPLPPGTPASHSCWCWNSATHTHIDAGTAQRTLILRLELHNTLMVMLEQHNTLSSCGWYSATHTHVSAGTVQHSPTDDETAQHTRNPHVTTYMNYSKSWDISSNKFPVSVLHVEINLWWWKLYSYKYFT